MTTALISHPDCLNHVTPAGHPEQVARLEYILNALEGKTLARLEAPKADPEAILRVHPDQYVTAINNAAPRDDTIALDGDTFMSPGSLTAAYRAAGGNVLAVNKVIAGEVQNAFVACRPPGHHAETARAMGFCLFGNVAIAAKHALDVHGLSRVAIVDFDVHHGNGTQDLLENDARVLFCSTHEMPLYPGTGGAHETGSHNNVLNVPLRAGDGSAKFRAVMQDQVLPAVAAFDPEFLIVSAGFDAHKSDPLAGLAFETQDFAWVTEALCDVADAHCQGRIISSLEGGYDLNALAASTAAHVDVLIKRGAK